MTKLLPLILLTLCLACSQEPVGESTPDMSAEVADCAPTGPAPDLAVAPPAPELLAVVPLYVHPSDTTNWGPIRDHRVQVIANGRPFAGRQVLPTWFSFWTRYTGVGEPVRVDWLMRFTGCITRGPNSVACDVLADEAARGMAFELCFRDPIKEVGLGDRMTCLPAALFVD